MKDLKNEIAGLARKYRLQIIYAFGSRAKEIYGRVAGRTRRSSRSKSDLDIGVKPEKCLSIKEKVDIATFFEDLFDVPKVDVVVIPEAPALLAYEIVSGELLYANDENFEAEYQSFTMRRAGDGLPSEHLKIETILGNKMKSVEITSNLLVQRAAWIRKMLDSIRELPLKTKDAFIHNKHNVAAAESYLRRALEALFDIGRHILAKRFDLPAAEFKKIAEGLLGKKVLARKDAEILRQMAGYRNRMVHFYHEIGPEELYEICTIHIDEISLVLNKLINWALKDQKNKK